MCSFSKVLLPGGVPERRGSCTVAPVSVAACAVLLPPSLFAPCSDGCYISKGYDATTHFETTVDDVLDMYKRITGKDIDLNSKDPRLAQQQE